MQLGFDFADDLAPSFQEQPAGTWTDPAFVFSDYMTRFAKADGVLLSLAGAGRAVFAQGLATAKEQHAAMQEHRERSDDEPYRLWRSNFKPSAEVLAAFVAHCETMALSSFPGIEYKTRRTHGGFYTAGMFVRDLGSVIVHRWNDGSMAADFVLFRHSFFLTSYRDELHAVYAPCATWAPAYCADKLAYSDSGVASVPTFVLSGREYVNDGGSGHGAYRECEGWSLTPRSAWTGPTYSYREQCRAWDDGRLERGDRRGLVVRVRGDLCVLDGAIVVFDDKATNEVFLSAEDEAEGMADDLDEDAELLEEEALAE